MSQTPNPWEQELWDLLCELYKALGGDCADLPLGLSEAIATVDEKHQTSGPPDFGSPEELAAFIELLTKIENALESPDNTLGEQDGELIATLLGQIRDDIGA